MSRAPSIIAISSRSMYDKYDKLTSIGDASQSPSGDEKERQTGVRRKKVVYLMSGSADFCLTDGFPRILH